MSDLFDDPTPSDRPGQNAPEFTVSEISGEVKRTLEGTFGRIRVKGEVGRVFKARSGHLYYDIKDDRSVLACTTWKGQIASLSVVPEEGLEVVVTGRLTAFGGQSKYNMNVDEVAVAGQGALMALLEKRKKQLEAEGLFAPERKKPLPYLPQIIGVVTSPSGAVIRDILHRLRDRFPRKVLVWPVAVQGPNCAPEVARAIEGFNQLTPGGALPRPDLIIVARGGGSIEDLWGFNEEIVARAVANSQIPLISAVGHETDTTLIDFVSDRRAPTPTAAAELAVPVRLELLGWTENQGARLVRSAGQAVQQRRQRLNDLARALPKPDTLLETPRQRLDRVSERLPDALIRGVERRRLRLSEAAAALRPSTLRQLVTARQDRLRNLSSRLTLRPIQQELGRQRDHIGQLAQRLETVQTQRLDRHRHRLEATGRQLEILSYKATLERGYAVVRSKDGVVTRAADAATQAGLRIEFADAEIAVMTGEAGTADRAMPSTKKPSASKSEASKPGKRQSGKAAPDDQGSLF
ncbi:exodeoxyribonuclease VII large subunit [Phaeobacter gallaeciensis]|uniref:Exodeoxyribonuclease 7 large subunit n=1 Tax=Phaeobacter gallaeciensis TaxID=60890 RepID=A0AAD0EAN2_9RHOB|nr:exodeoxyribonuclease VII large subunit [Phaeobacter gallaeciensis]AHD08804.1 Exodeoxyribonuclease VII large subunit [Phaeobacter gallaeciensis DSM 26640]ATE92070.1 exodeoxyribonuclease 7 large subunit [Phaeobacter gallaeciensis]ATE98106.1 exodeoxyribonuclease 7 large subunit [Phaeobacter gallaeciensis]ATF00686.1 exodeoxyribonuclease 7 large subunit [Phaeobacter gallaeciensis]ATF05117.1 exodeoxyribonuclease 7 large subunit [Phaeobacter gallaeciensis]